MLQMETLSSDITMPPIQKDQGCIDVLAKRFWPLETHDTLAGARAELSLLPYRFSRRCPTVR